LFFAEGLQKWVLEDIIYCDAIFRVWIK
jgi:hypothetical protein